MQFLTRITATQDTRAVELVRPMAGPVFPSEGPKSFLIPVEVGAAHFCSLDDLIKGALRPEKGIGPHSEEGR